MFRIGASKVLRALCTAAKTKLPLACGQGTGEGVSTHVSARVPAGPRPGSISVASPVSVPLALVSGHRTVLTITHSQDLPEPGVEKASRRGKTTGKLFSVKAGLFFLAIMSD